MKFSKILIHSFLITMILSCQKDEVKSLVDEDATLKKIENLQNSCKFNVYGTYVSNGMPSKTKNNILAFPDEKSYLALLDHLEKAVDAYDDNFLSKHSNLTEDELDDLEEKINYDPNTPIKDFESMHGFYSLRSYSELQENLWLDNSIDQKWSWEDDPTDNLLVHGLEQSLYNRYNEFIICKTLYKLTRQGVLYIPVNHSNLSKILADINYGEDPEKVISKFGGKVVNLDNRQELKIPQPDGPVFERTSESTKNTSCVYRVNRTVRIIHPNNSNRRIKAKQIMREGPFNMTYKAITKGYKKRRGKWRKRRTRIAAGVTGYTHDKRFGCPSTSYVNSIGTIKKRRRREKAYRISRKGIVPGYIGANNRQLKTKHYQEGVWHQLFFEL